MIGGVKGPIRARGHLVRQVLEAIDASPDSAQTVAARAGLPPSMLSNLRSGRRDNVGLNNFIAIATAAGFNVVLVRK